MAGRGTDIMLGGNPDFRADLELRSRGLDPAETPEEYDKAWGEALEKARAAVQAEHDEVTELGGLYVLGTERHESRRIDNQLRGRSGRQGDPGESRFYLSLQDDLMRLFNAAMVDRFMTTAKMEDEVPIESKMVSRSIQSAQGQVEGRNFEIRKNVLKYDDVLNRQRTVIYKERRRVLEGEDLQEQVRMFINDVVNGYIDSETSEGFADDWDLDRLWTALKTLYPVSVTPDDVVEAVAGGDRGSLTVDDLREQITSDAHHAYDAREAELGEEVMREVERRVVLSVLDRKWREHLYEMDYLQEGIGLRAMAQRDPLVEYQREGFQLFEAMNESIKEESVGYLFNVQVDVDQPAEAAPAAPALQPMSVSDMLAGSGLSGAQSPAEDGTAAGASLVEDRREDALAAPAARDDAALAAAETKTVTDQHPTFRAKGLEQPQRRQQQLQYSAPGETGGTEHRSVGTVDDTLSPEQLKGASRNGPCPCGSGKKFKMCHGRA
jgi:preprotein translocase subunit SecA